MHKLMILMKKVQSYLIVLLISFIIEINCCVKYKFKTEKVQRIRFGTVDPKYVQKNHFSQLKYEDWKKLCNKVREFDSLQFLPNYEYYLFGAKPSEVENMGKKEHLLVGYCPTIPEVYLKIGNSEDVIELMYELTVADLYEYEVVSVKSIAKAQLTQEVRKEMEQHALFSLNNDTSWKFCIAAQRKFKHLTLDFALVKTEIYHIVDSTNEASDLPGFECPTLPYSLYLRLGDAENKMIIMFIDVNDEIVV